MTIIDHRNGAGDVGAITTVFTSGTVSADGETLDNTDPGTPGIAAAAAIGTGQPFRINIHIARGDGRADIGAGGAGRASDA